VNTVSAIVPTRNRAPLVLRALASIAAQSRPPEEVIVVDDGSTDDVAARVAAAFPAVRLLRTPPRGVAAARNAGIAAARGDWLAFLDSDDEWLADKLEAQLAALAAEPGMAVCHCDEIWIRHHRRVNPRRRHRKSGGRIFQRCLPLCAISPSAAVVHRRVFEEVGLFDESFEACEDYELWLRITARWPVLYVDRPLVRKHGGHADQLSRTVPALDRLRIRALHKILVAGDLDPGDRRAAVATLRRKIAVYARGVCRRGRHAEAAALARLRDRWAGEVSPERTGQVSS